MERVKQTKEIMVTVCCLAYNHEKYIRKALDSFVMQKTNFNFEVLINDDASTDNTANILREYERKYPDIIKPIYQKENQYSQGKKINVEILFPNATGKYIATCETDDYWTDDKKLQKQYDALEQNPNCVFCAHKTRRIKGANMQLAGFIPRIGFSKNIVKPDEFVNRIFLERPFQVSSFFFKSQYVKDLYKNIPDFYSLSSVGDIPLMLYFSTLGDVYYIDEEMSCYRTDADNNWTHKQRTSLHLLIKRKNNAIDVAEKFNVYTHQKYNDVIKEYTLVCEYLKLLYSKKYRTMQKEPYKKIFARLTDSRAKKYYKFFGLFPFLEKPYQALKHKRQ